MTHLSRLAGIACLVVALTAADAFAIPVFARKYNLPCMACHTGDFKLNAFGAAVDLNGFQLPGLIDRTPIWNSTGFPVSILFQDRVSHLESYSGDGKSFFTRGSQKPDTVNDFLNSLVMTVVAGGVIAPHVSLMSELDFENNGIELQAGLEYAFVNFNNIFSTDRGQFNIRLGKLRMETPIEQTPEFYQSRYLIYDYPILISSRAQSYWLSFPMYGAMTNAELSFIPTAPQLTTAFATGDLGDQPFTSARMWYNRLQQDVEIADVPASLGLTCILGHQTLDPKGGGALLNDATAFGLDWQINQPHGGPLTLYGQVMSFHENDVQQSPGMQSEDAFGGYVELNDVVIPEKVTLQARYDFLNTKRTQPESREVNTSQYTLIGRYHLMANAHLFVEAHLLKSETVVSSITTPQNSLLVSGGFFIGL